MRNLQRLFDILSLGNQDAKAHYIKQHYHRYCQQDDYGNLYLSRDFTTQKPYLVAHIDTVDEQPKSKHIVVDPYIKIISSTRHGKSCNLGADDGVGVYAALKLFDELDIGVALFRDEEVGCLGSAKADSKLINAHYLIQLDRKGHEDMIFNAAGTIMASDAFIEDVTQVAKRFDFHETYGGMTDVATLSANQIVKVSCMNLSCGYYKPHTDEEYIDINVMNNSIAFVREIIMALGNTTFPHEGMDEYHSYQYAYPNDIRVFLKSLIDSTMRDDEILDELYFYIQDQEFNHVGF